MSSDVLIDAKKLSKCYQIYDKPSHRLWQMIARQKKQFYREFWALHDVSLSIHKGETVGIIGRNGSGKSTLLQLICGTLRATTGTVSSKGRIAALLELGSGFNLEFTGKENVYMNAAVLGLSQSQIEDRYDEICAFAAIGDFINQPVKTYSSGMLVRLAFAVSVCVDPDILIVDEALSVGDASFQFKCLNRLENLTDSGSTLLFVSHDMSMVKRFCKRVIYLRDGRVVASGNAEEMAELYLLDMRNEQRRWASEGAISVARKAHLGDEKNKNIAFGTQEGYLREVYFTSTQQLFCSYRFGDEVEIEAYAQLHESIMQPNLSITIQETRLLVIGGVNFPLPVGPVVDGWYSTSVVMRFRVKLGPGRYHITFKLMNGNTEDSSQLIEKQVALLAFDVLPNSEGFLGLIDLDIRHEYLTIKTQI